MTNDPSRTQVHWSDLLGYGFICQLFEISTYSLDQIDLKPSSKLSQAWFEFENISINNLKKVSKVMLVLTLL